MTAHENPDAWDDDPGPLYIMEEIQAPPLTRNVSLDEENLRVLSSFVHPLPPEEAEKRRQAYASTEGGYLTRETIMRALLGEFNG